MRKFVKEQVIELLSTLWEGTRYVKENKSAAGIVIPDCLAVADVIANVLKPSTSPDRFAQYTEQVDALKEKLDLFHAALSGDEAIEKSAKDIKRQLVLLENSIRGESRVTLEIVFLSYKASMWDSLESIWLAARDDPDCEAYVVPIPYFDKNTDRSLGGMIYEGDAYPGHVPITDWQNYDIAARRPDIIFTHAPYDSGNIVTSIHSDFYCERLKDFTDMLVYVPYFVCGADIHEEAFCINPGTIYADRVIVQSERVRQTYIRFFKKFEAENGAKGRFGKPEEKFVALGSPKLDKVVNTKSGDNPLPEEWTKLIKGRKTVLYNTSVGALLRGDEQYLAKLRSVLDTFHRNNDVVLWWRPHPLSKTTYQSMRPHLVNEYMAIVEDYRRAGFGIYDDTPDLHRAIAASDAYYGDPSSLVSLYNGTGKPVLIQNIDMSDYSDPSDSRKISFFSFTVREGILWAVSSDLNGLFSMDLEDKGLKYHGEITGELMFGECLYSSLAVDTNKIIVLPFNGNAVVEYDIPGNTFTRTPFGDFTTGKFLSSYVYGKTLYAIPRFYPALIKYDLETGEITEDRRLCSELDKNGIGGGYFIRGSAMDDHTLTLASCTSNIIVKYDLDSGQYSLKRIGDPQNRYIDMLFDGNDYWLLDFSKGILRWNEKTGQVVHINSFPDNFVPGGAYDFLCSIAFDDAVFVFPYHSNMILRLNTGTNETEEFIDLNQRQRHASFNYSKPKYFHAERVGDYIYASSCYENCLQKINPKTGEIENIPLILSDEDYRQIIDKPLFVSSCHSYSDSWQSNEKAMVGLPFFLNRLAAENMEENGFHTDRRIARIFENADGSCGIRTHEYIKSAVSREAG